MKLHAVYSVRAGGVISVEKTAGSVHDGDGFWPKSWQPAALYIRDLGFTSNERFIDAAKAEAHVLQRLKSAGNPVVLASYGEGGHRRRRATDTVRRPFMSKRTRRNHSSQQKAAPPPASTDRAAPVAEEDVEATPWATTPW